MTSSDKIEGILRNLAQYLAILRQIAGLPKNELLSDAARIGGARYYLQVAVECCVDAANHLIAHYNWRRPKNHADSFTVLAEQAVIPASFLTTAYQMVGMRNRLVHLYWDIDDEMLYHTLQTGLGDFDQFSAAIYTFLARQQ